MRTLLFQKKTQIFVSVIRLTETDNRIKTLNGRGSGIMDAADVFVPVMTDNQQSSTGVLELTYEWRGKIESGWAKDMNFNGYSLF